MMRFTRYVKKEIGYYIEQKENLQNLHLVAITSRSKVEEKERDAYR